MNAVAQADVRGEVDAEFLALLSALRKAQAEDAAADEAIEAAEARSNAAAEALEIARKALAAHLWSKRRRRLNYGDEGNFSPVIAAGGMAYVATNLGTSVETGPSLMVLDLMPAPAPDAFASIEAAALSLLDRRRELRAVHDDDASEEEVDQAEQAYIRAQGNLQSLLLANPRFVPGHGCHGRPLVVGGVSIFLDERSLREPGSHGLVVVDVADLGSPAKKGEDGPVPAVASSPAGLAEPGGNPLLAALAERDSLMERYLSVRDSPGDEVGIQSAWQAMASAQDEVRRLADLAGLIPSEPDTCSCEYSSAIAGRHVLVFNHRGDGQVDMSITSGQQAHPAPPAEV